MVSKFVGAVVSKTGELDELFSCLSSHRNLTYENRLATLTGFETAFNISQIRAIPAETFCNQRVECIR